MNSEKGKRRRERPSWNVRLYGTDEAADQVRHVLAGSLSLVLHNGALRNICFGGREAIRGIAFIVRDKDWGTFNPVISNLEIDARESAFQIRYDAICKDEEQALRYRAEIEGKADGSLRFDVEGLPDTPFLTSRTGFVVLHPVDEVAGHAVVVTHTDGTHEAASFPATIKPSQPFVDIRSLKHELAPGIFVTCTMQGDAFEMEDQRNWSDASYKTYIRPLTKPHPYVLEAGEAFAQSVVLDIDGPAPSKSNASAKGSIDVTLGTDPAGRLPALALASAPEYLAASIESAALIRQTGIGRIFCYYDPAAGHDAVTLSGYRQLAAATGADLVLEAVLPLRNADGEFTDNREVLEAEVADIAQLAEDAGVVLAAITASPACYHKSYQPSGPWPAAPALQDVYAEVRRQFPGSQVGAGMHSYFTEFNRRPPPVDDADFVTHSTCPIVHAGDDLSVMETLEALPWIFRSVREHAPDLPYWIGPSAIGMRFNPYGSAAILTPGDTRGAMVTRDPRQRGLFNAAWTLGYIARAAAGKVSGLCLSAAAGPFSIGWHPMDWRQPWFDENNGAARVFPVYHVIEGLARRAGSRVLAVENPAPSRLAVLGLEVGEGLELWLANLTAEPQRIRLEDLPGNAVIRCLDAESFEQCCVHSHSFSSTEKALTGNQVILGAYGIACIA